MKDEVLCHRLGLLPIFANPAHFEFPQPLPIGEEPKDPAEEPKGDAKLNIIFELNVNTLIPKIYKYGKF